MSKGLRFAAVLLIAAALLLSVQCQKKASTVSEGEKYLLIWAGDQARKASDFLAVVNFDPVSDDYGKVIKTIPLPNPGNAGNEPHHVGISANGKTMACGGLLSVLKGQKEVFFFDVSNPADPDKIQGLPPSISEDLKTLLSECSERKYRPDRPRPEEMDRSLRQARSVVKLLKELHQKRGSQV